MSKRSKPLILPELVDSEGVTSQAGVYLRLRHALMIGAIEPGVAITIQDITDALQVSATPVREALRQLSTEKALLTLENRRITVPEMTAARFEELINLRCTLEVYAARSAMPYISKVAVDELENIDAQINAAVDAGDWPLTVVLNQRFHSALYLANPEQVAMPMIESLWLQLGPFMRIAGRFQQDLYQVDRHQEALEALRHNDEQGLAQAIEADIRDAVGGLKPEIIARILEDSEQEQR